MEKKETPLMKQYKEIKSRYKNEILFFRLGDFYETFFEDAVISSEILGITLTSRNKEKDKAVPLAGVPYHSAQSYIHKLVNAGYNVAICEQIGEATGKNIVEREVVQVITAGTIVDIDIIDSKENNYLASIYRYEDIIAISYIDITTSEFKVIEVNKNELLNEIKKINPSEVLLLEKDKDLIKDILAKITIVSKIKNPDKFLLEYFHIISLDSFGIHNKLSAINAVALIIDYLLTVQLNKNININKLRYITNIDYADISYNTANTLEIFKNQRDKSNYGSLLWVLDKCKTAMGSRVLKQWLNKPLMDIDEIISRQDDIAFYIDNIIIREEIRESLVNVYDIERLASKLLFGNANAKDMIALKNTIYYSLKIKELIPDKFNDININILIDIHNMIDKTIVEEPPFSVREGNMIKRGYHQELDNIHNIMKNGKNYLLDIESREKIDTGIKNLRIKYNKVMGYFIEITNSNKDNVPDRYIRKQTLSNSERYITEELKKYEDTIINAKAKVEELEYNIFKNLVDEIKKYEDELLLLANTIAYTDIITNLAIIAVENKYIRPKFCKDKINIKKGRHPIVEKLIGENEFVSNDIYFDNKENFIILTGPNMAGKSTYMKQIALLSIMAQIGSYIPAESAYISIIDKYLTRIGAADDIISGQSTFMVEMSEVSNIINNATSNSLIILDEVGRGTSTYDGLSLATSISEYIHNNIKAKTIFATHYHELTELEKQYDNIVNYRIEVHDKNNKILFLRTITRGGADKSYGIEVARLAGLPQTILSNSKKILKKLEIRKNILKENMNNQQLSLFQNYIDDSIEEDDKNEEKLELLDELIDSINNIDINNITPLESMGLLNKLKKKIDNK